jgi:hypothetical protein
MGGSSRSDERVVLPPAQPGWAVVDEADRVLASAATGRTAPGDLAELCSIVQAERGPVLIAGHEAGPHEVVVTYAEGCLVSSVRYRDGTRH